MNRHLTALPVLLLLAACVDEGSSPTDKEVVEPTYSDQDGDYILDLHEGFIDPEAQDTASDGLYSRDSDGDGTPDYLDTDSDNDGILDAVEGGDSDVWTLPWDSDTDTIPDYLDTDSDGNCIPDSEDGEGEMDADGIRDYADLDDDGDTIGDVYEIGSGCVVVDSDGDGTPDYRDEDSDGDGIGDIWEAGTSAWESEPTDVDLDGVPNYLDSDSDGDGMGDAEEGRVSLPSDEPADTDGDGLYDFLDIDSDGDGLSDSDERNQYGTDPYTADSDGDGFSDGAEVAAGTDPNDTGSVIDGLYVTVPERTNTLEDFEFELTVQMGDIVFLLDTTCSMGSTLNGMANEFSSIVSQLTSTLPDAEYGVATYDDYAYGGYGSTSYGDKPFILKQQVTDNVGSVQSTLSSLSTHGGSDGPESGMEALYQTLTGQGYDQDCDGTYDSSTDVRPFLSGGADAFSGGGGQSYNSSTSGGGEVGGMGFRDYALPVIVYATDNYLRDPDTGYGTPPSCSNPAGGSDVITAVNNANAYLIGIAAGSSTATAQMNMLANATGSYADTDGDGSTDDALVFSWTGSNASLRTTIVNAIGDLVDSVQFDEVSLQVEGDEWGFVSSISPETYPLSGAVSGQVIDFTIGFRGAVAAQDEDAIYRLTLNVFGDGTVLLDTYDIYVLVPGSSY
jgi:hypothetical protein